VVLEKPEIFIVSTVTVDLISIKGNKCSLERVKKQRKEKM